MYDHQRKPNRLSNYDYSENGSYFITICVKDRHDMLGQITVGGDAHIAPYTEISEYGRIAEYYLHRMEFLEKYVIMPNHIHLIIQLPKQSGAMWALPPTQSIPQIIKTFKILVTKHIGFSLWQRSYHDHIIRNDDEYQRILEYIDSNPQHWAEDCYHATSCPQLEKPITTRNRQ